MDVNPAKVHWDIGKLGIKNLLGGKGPPKVVLVPAQPKDPAQLGLGVPLVVFAESFHHLGNRFAAGEIDLEHELSLLQQVNMGIDEARQDKIVSKVNLLLRPTR